MRYVVIVLALCVAALPLRAQETVASANLPESVLLEGMTLFLQDYNRCSAAAYSIQLSYFTTSDYQANVLRLNPHTEDVSVRLDEMVTAAEEVGLKGVVRYGGTIEMLKTLLAAGFPVLIENEYYEGPNGFDDWSSHNRVAIGYDEATQEIIFYDSLLSNNTTPLVRRKYADVLQRWRAFNNDYLVLYKPEDEAKVQAALGPMWDATANAEWVLEKAEAEIAGENRDSFAVYNKGWALTKLGRYEEAVEAFDLAQRIGLPWRFFWYEFTIFDAYLATGRYDEVEKLVRATLVGTPGVEELYYYIALAYEGRGNQERALANLEAALYRNRFFRAAQEKYEDLKGS